VHPAVPQIFRIPVGPFSTGFSPFFHFFFPPVSTSPIGDGTFSSPPAGTGVDITTGLKAKFITNTAASYCSPLILSGEGELEGKTRGRCDFRCITGDNGSGDGQEDVDEALGVTNPELSWPWSEMSYLLVPFWPVALFIWIFYETNEEYCDKLRKRRLKGI